MDELDQLIEGVLNDEGDSDESPQDDETPVVSDATDTAAETDDEGYVPSEDDSELEIPQDEDLPEEEDDTSEEPDGTGTPPAVDPAPSPELLKLQQQVAQQQAFIRSVIEEAKAESEKQKKQDEENEYKKLLEQWDEMDPDEARREQVAYLANRAAERDKALRAENEQLRQQITTKEQQEQQAKYLAAENEAKAIVIEHLSKQHKLTELEKWTIGQFSSPEQMENYAKQAQELRKEQTAAAREARRQELEGNPALKGGEPGNGSPKIKLDPPTTPEELIDRIFQ